MRITTIFKAVGLSCALIAGGASSGNVIGVKPAFAADAPKKVSAKLGKQFQEAQSLVTQRKFKEALAKLDELKAAPGKSAYENFVIAQLAYASYNGLQQYGDAAKAAEAALETGQVPEAQKQTLRKGVVQNYFLAKNIAKFNEESARYQKDFGPDLDLQNLSVQALYQGGNYKAAAEAGRQLIKAAEAKGVPVKEEWLKLIRFAEHEQGNSTGEQAALEQLVQRFPSREYWADLLLMAQRNIKGSTKSQLEIYRIMYSAGVLSKPEDYMEMAQLAIQAGVPMEATKVIEAGMKKGVLGQGQQKDRQIRLLNMAKSQADEGLKALPTTDSEAKAAPTGDADVKVGEVYWATGQNDKAIEAIQRGLKKGVKDKDDAALRLGIVYLASGKRTQATDAFKTIAPNTPSAQVARLWSLYSSTKQL
jgi:tetratricopeptide (TPR) repeat protein